MKKITFVLFICLLMFSFASAKDTYLDVNNVRFYFNDSSGYFTGPQYPQKAGGLLNQSFPTPGGRTYAFGPMFIWGNGLAAPGPVATEANPDVSVPTVWDGTQYTQGAFITGTKQQANVATSYVINSLGGEDYRVSNVTTSVDEDWYSPALGTGTPDVKWPYSNLKYAYNSASVEPWINVTTGDYHSSDAFLNPLPGYELADPDKKAYHLYVDDTSLITDLTDYVMVFDGTDFDIFEITSYDTNYDPVYGATPVATFAPDTDATFNGIAINMNAGSVTPLTAGDAYIIRARGIVGDMDMVLPMVDAKWLGTGAQQTGDPTAAPYGDMDVVILIRAYAWTASYIDTTVVFDVTFDNQSSRTYENFAAGFHEYVMMCDAFNDVVQYHSDKNLLLMYDYDGESDVDIVGAGSSDDVQWHSGDFGGSPYAMLGVKILKPLTKEDSTPASRFSLKTGYGAEFFPYQNGFSLPTDITGNPLDFVPVVAALYTGGTTSEAFASCDPTDPSFGGFIMRTDGSINAWFWNDDIWDMMVSGRINYCYEPDHLENASEFYYYWRSTLDPSYSGGYRRGSASSTLGWYIGSLAPAERANLVFAIFAIEGAQEGWAGYDYPQEGEATYDAAMELNDSLELLYENGFAPKFAPIRPVMLATQGWSDLYGFENQTIQLEIMANSESSFITQLSDDFIVSNYIIKRYDGTTYATVLNLYALNDPYWWGDPAGIYSFYEMIRDYYPSYMPYYFALDADYANNHIIWVQSDNYGNVIIESDPDLTFKIGFRVNDGETLAESYVIVITDNVFGYSYKYTVQAQDYAGSLSAAAGDNKFDIVPASSPVENLDEVRVVPNPLFVGTRWDKYSEVSEVKFNHIPGECTIKIFNINGDLLREIAHDNGLAWASWDLLTKYNQEIAPGMYIYVIESDLGKTKGTFAVVR